MKKILSSLIFLVLVSMFIFVSAQKYEPTTSWPYVYENFQQGTVYFRNGDKQVLKLNIHLSGSKLHYVKNDMIYLADESSSIDSVVIVSNEKYIPSDLGFVKIIAQSKNNKLVLQILGDFDALNATKGAYGTPSHTSSAENLAGIELAGGNISNLNHRKLMLEKTEGRFLPEKRTYFFIFNDNKIIKASNKDIRATLSKSEQEKFNIFRKKNKINWSNPADLMKVLDYLSAN